MKRLLVLFYLFLSYTSVAQNEALEDLIIELTFQKPDTTKVRTSLDIIKILYDAKSYDRALRYIKQTEKLSENLNYTKGVAETAYITALIYKQKNDYINASIQFNRAKGIYSSINNILAISKINNHLGVLEIERGNFDTGLKYALDGIDELEKQDLKTDLLIAYNSLASAYEKTNLIDRAIDYNLKSLAISKTQNNTKALIDNYVSLGRLHQTKQNPTKTIYYYEKALDYIANKNTILKADILPDLGGAYLQTNNLKASSKHLVDAVKLNRALNNTTGLLKTLNTLAEFSLKRRYYKSAKKQLIEARRIARDLNNRTELLKNYTLSKQLDSILGNYKNAYIWQSRCHTIETAILEEKHLQNNSLIKNNTSTQSNNTTALAKDSLKNEASINSQKALDKYKLFFYGLLGAFAIISILFILFYLKRNNRLKYTEELEKKNKEIETQNKAILEQSKNLENINKVKDKLFSIVSHDLKDSLSSTKGFIDLLKEGQLSHDEFHKLLPELSENANNASLLLFNLLNWSKSQMQSFKANAQLFNVEEVFIEKTKLIEHKLKSKGVTLINNTIPDFIHADKSMVEIIIQNLLTNAIKFCENGDSITISNTITNGKAILSVADTGVGITVENQKKLFNNSFTTFGTGNEKGTGLGLTICRELVELNEGRIWANSEINKGTTFFVELPKTKLEALKVV